MSNLNGPITALLAVMVVAFGGALCLLAGGKTDRARGLIIVLLVITALSGFATHLLVRNYYALLTSNAISSLMFLICLTGIVFSAWLEWASPPPAVIWQNQDYRFRSLVNSTLLPIITVALIFMVLPKITDCLLDLASGPTREIAVVENSRHGRVTGGTFVANGIAYETWDETLWSKSLNREQSIEFAYGPNTKFALSPEPTTFETAGVVIPLILLCLDCGLAYLVARKLPQSRISQPLKHADNPSQQAVEALITHFSSGQQRISRSDWILTVILLVPLAVILIVIFFGLTTH